MGCRPSVQNEPNIMENFDEKFILKTSETYLQAYLRIDSAISLAEKSCPGARLSRAERWLNEIVSKEAASMQQQVHDDDVEEVIIVDKEDGIINNGHDFMKKQEEKEDDAVGKIALQLGVVTNPTLGAKHEEFIAEISRGSIESIRRSIRQEIRAAAERRIQTLIVQVRNLQKLYADQDKLLGMIFGSSYASALERQLEMELEQVRISRDALGAAAEPWRTAGALLKAAAKGALQAAQSWEILGSTGVAEERLSLGTECRSCAVAALAGVAAARDLLADVDMPYVTPRQMSAVNHATLYMLTDMANELRYKHTLRVLNAFRDNTTHLVKWLHETYKNTLQKDIADAEKTVNEVHNRLRTERIKLIKEKEEENMMKT